MLGSRCISLLVYGEWLAQLLGQPLGERKSSSAGYQYKLTRVSTLLYAGSYKNYARSVNRSTTAKKTSGEDVDIFAKSSEMRGNYKVSLLTFAPPERVRVREHSFEQSRHVELGQLKSMSANRVDKQV